MKTKLIILLYFSFLSISIFAQNWMPLGPFNKSSNDIGLPNGQGSGRIEAIAIHPKYNTADATIGGVINKTIFAGSPYGGLWISRDDGANWANSDPLNQYTNLSTDFFRGAGVLSIAIDYNTPTTLYAVVCANEYYAGYNLGWSVIQGKALIGDVFPCSGIYKYTPSTGWVVKVSFPYTSNHSVAALTLDPINPNIIYASTSDGITKSIDGGNTWSSILTAGIEVPFRNVKFDPTNSANIFASGPDVFESTNGGTSWSNISNFHTLIPNHKITILANISVLSATSIYAEVNYLNTSDVRLDSHYHYDGTTWTLLPASPYQGSYPFLELLAKKVGTTEYLFSGELRTRCYNSSTNSWTTISGYGTDMHGDIREFAFSPDGSTFFVGHDGGISKTTANFYTTPVWSTINTGLNIATIYSFAGAQKNSKLMLVGEVDNGDSYVGNADENNYNAITWNGYKMCDGGDKMISWDNPNEWYDRQQMYGGSLIVRNLSGTPSYANPIVFDKSTFSPPVFNGPGTWDQGWEHTEFEEFGSEKPMVMDPNNTNIVYYGTNILTRSTDNGATSQVIFRKNDCFLGGDPLAQDITSHITSIAIAPSNSNYLYVNYLNPYFDQPLNSNHIYKTTNALSSNYTATCSHAPTHLGINCANWTDITPPFPSLPASYLKRSAINAIVVSDKDPNLIWAAFTYNPLCPNFLVWKYDGTTWTDYGTGLPANISITSLVYEKGSNDGMYAGTDVGGVYYRNKNTNWVPYGSNLPHASVVHMEINYSDNTLRVGTMGRGIWKTALSCPNANLDFVNIAIAPNFYEAVNITATNSQISSSGITTLRASTSIALLPNFDGLVSAGGTFAAFIHGCSTPGNSFRVSENANDPSLTINSMQEKDDKEQLMVYPNPNNGVFTITKKDEDKASAEVFDVNGKLVYKTFIDEEKTELKLSNIESGIYLLQITTKSLVTTKHKIVIMK